MKIAESYIHEEVDAALTGIAAPAGSEEDRKSKGALISLFTRALWDLHCIAEAMTERNANGR